MNKAILSIAIILSMFSNAEAQVFTADNRASLLTGNISFNHYSQEEMSQFNGSIGTEYDYLVFHGFFAGINMAYEMNRFVYKPEGQESEKFSHRSFLAGPQIGYIFGKPDWVFYPFIKLGGHYTFIAQTNLPEDSKEGFIQYFYSGGVLVRISDHVGISLSLMKKNAINREDQEVNYFPFHKRMTMLELGVKGILYKGS